MSERIVIEAEPRQVIGKQVSQLRREGWIPGVIYGRKEPVSVQMEQKALRRALRTVGTTHLADVKIGGQLRTVLVLSLIHISKRIIALPLLQFLKLSMLS